MPTDNIAAIDLGSNSFHMLIARMADGDIQIVDRIRDMVQLAAGLDEDQRLTRETRERALACLARFGQRLRHLPPGQVRVVGTNTLRKARNSEGFLKRAGRALGHQVEIISGIEEARLIYLGVAHSSAPVRGRRLVIDIGGGSTELIIGSGFRPLRLESLYMGCVSMSRRFFEDGGLREKALRAAEVAGRLELEPVRAAYRRTGWSVATGASGTIKTIRDIVSAEKWCAEGIDRASLARLRGALRQCASVEAAAERWSLSPARARGLPGGAMVLKAVVDGLGIDRLEVADGALREGVVYDLLGRINHEDVRERTVVMLEQRYKVDTEHGRRVALSANKLLTRARDDWKLDDDRLRLLLIWAARVHEVGLSIAHGQYHKHGGYILYHSDLSGFSKTEQILLAALVRGHRRKFPTPVFDDIAAPRRKKALRLCILLRLAVLLHRGHRRRSPPTPVLRVRGRRFDLRFPDRWLERHPLTAADLDAEARLLKKTGIELRFR